MRPLELTILGAAAARPYADNGTSAVYLQLGGTRLLIDCGEGTQIELDRNRCSAAKLNTICITHMHGDHIFGLPGLLSSLALGSRTKPLLLIGPRSLQAYVESALGYAGAHLSYQLQYVVTDPAQPQHNVATLPDLAISTLPLDHRVEASGFSVSEKDKGRSIRPSVIDSYQIPYHLIEGLRAGEDFITASGARILNVDLTHDAPPLRSVLYLTDTALLREIPSEFTSPTLLVHDSTFANADLKLAQSTRHSTALQAAAFAKTCLAQELLLIHTSARYKNADILLDEAKTAFAKTQLARPGLRITL